MSTFDFLFSTNMSESFEFRKKKKEYLWVFVVASFMKLLTLLLLLSAFCFRFGRQKEKNTSAKLFYCAFGFDFFPLLFHCCVVVPFTRSWNDFWTFFYHSKGRFLFVLLHFSLGISLTVAFGTSNHVSVPSTKGLAGLYCIICAYEAFQTWKYILPPTASEMFGWFEVVFWNIIKLLAVSFKKLFELVILSHYIAGSQLASVDICLCLLHSIQQF